MNNCKPHSQCWCEWHYEQSGGHIHPKCQSPLNTASTTVLIILAVVLGAYKLIKRR